VDKIKFQVYDPEKQRIGMVLVLYTGSDFNAYAAEVDFGEKVSETVFDPILLQYTCRDDKNGKEIYNGDEIIYSMSQTQHRRGYVFCEAGQWLIDVRWQKNDSWEELLPGYDMEHSKGTMVNRLSDDLYDVEVIGKNPELSDQTEKEE